MAKFKFISKKEKDKIKLFGICKNEIPNEVIGGAHIDIISNKKATVEGCLGVLDYRDGYISLKLAKGNIVFSGKELKITYFENKTINILGLIENLEFNI